MWGGMLLWGMLDIKDLKLLIFRAVCLDMCSWEWENLRSLLKVVWSVGVLWDTTRRWIDWVRVEGGRRRVTGRGEFERIIVGWEIDTLPGDVVSGDVASGGVVSSGDVVFDVDIGKGREFCPLSCF